MKKTFGLLCTAGLLTAFLSGTQAFAESEKLETEGNITFERSLEPPVVVDPEDPEEPADPGDTPSTDGYLRLDFVPKLDFGRNKVSDKDQAYEVNAQLFHSDTNARGNYVQVTDSRATGAGWTLQVRQETEFTSVNNSEDVLKGAFLSFDKAWANSTMDQKYAPSFQQDVIELDKIGMTYNIATAEQGKGYGTWMIEFGASEENTAGLASTLTPLVDESGNAVMDATFNKQVHKNSAITFFVPGSVEKKPVHYQTVLTWIIAELP
ncbi:WxL domain-containing protein [Enterococcus sp. BWM-S5]|uniref:WxL domain-containing protein n=2 Tax=Enterococcus larvae TaxID=2794352 RepID=A0ABS4CHT3_9ENTE|nr:WxL domain-containing protein [Enterococcus larvae]